MQDEVQVLLVGEERQLLEQLALELHRSGIGAVATASPPTASHLIDAAQPALVVLCVELQAAAARSLLQELAAGHRADIMVVDHARAPTEATRAFELGADGYIAQQASLREVCARIQALLRRAMRTRSTAGLPDVLRVDAFELDLGQRTATYAARPLELTRTEFAILEQLLPRAGQVVPQHVLLRAAWGRYHGSSGLVRVAIHRLRRKLRTAGAMAVIETRPGRGFVLRVDSPGSA